MVIIVSVLVIITYKTSAMKFVSYHPYIESTTVLSDTKLVSQNWSLDSAISAHTSGKVLVM